MFVRELRVTYLARSDLQMPCEQEMTRPSLVASFLGPILNSEPVEVFVVVCLSARHRILCFREIARGAVNCVHVSPAEVFKTVLLANAPAFLVAHNHPSGDPTPSAEDVAITRALS